VYVEFFGRLLRSHEPTGPFERDLAPHAREFQWLYRFSSDERDQRIGSGLKIARNGPINTVSCQFSLLSMVVMTEWRGDRHSNSQVPFTPEIIEFWPENRDRFLSL
jgi:hypothetical protein